MCLLPSEIKILFFVILFITFILFGINLKLNTVKKLNKKYSICLYKGNTEQVCNRLYKQ